MQGDREQDGFERLIDDHAGMVYQLGLRFCGGADDAEDLVQEVFLRAHTGWEGYRGDASEKTWLYRIAANACQRLHRKRAGEPDSIGSLEELLPFGEPRIAEIPGESGSELDRQVRAEAIARVEREIAGLPDEYRVPLLLKEIVGFTVPEVASVLGMEEGTVRSRVHRARLKLRAAVDRALPRQAREAAPPAYDERACLDLLEAKQSALDRGVAFDEKVICERCRSVFASLDLTQEVCRELAGGGVPAGVRERLVARIASGG